MAGMGRRGMEWSVKARCSIERVGARLGMWQVMQASPALALQVPGEWQVWHVWLYWAGVESAWAGWHVPHQSFWPLACWQRLEASFSKWLVAEGESALGALKTKIASELLRGSPGV